MKHKAPLWKQRPHGYAAVEYLSHGNVIKITDFSWGNIDSLISFVAPPVSPEGASIDVMPPGRAKKNKSGS
jgi:hypothetical protein